MPQIEEERHEHHDRPLIAGQPEPQWHFWADEFGHEAKSKVGQDVELDQLPTEFTATLPVKQATSHHRMKDGLVQLRRMTRKMRIDGRGRKHDSPR